MTKHGEFNWNELQTSDTKSAIEFYGACIGWTFQAEQMPTGGTYWIVCTPSGKPVGGLLTLPEGMQDRWVTFIHVDDLDASIAHVSDCGGEVLRAAWTVPGVGRIAMIRDPGGAEFGLVTPA